jgi:hypothetical protein
MKPMRRVCRRGVPRAVAPSPKTRIAGQYQELPVPHVIVRPFGCMWDTAAPVVAASKVAIGCRPLTLWVPQRRPLCLPGRRKSALADGRSPMRPHITADLRRSATVRSIVVRGIPSWIAMSSGLISSRCRTTPSDEQKLTGGKVHHLIFVVDERGSFIGDSGDKISEVNSLAEMIGNKGKGKSKFWMICASQLDLEKVLDRTNFQPALVDRLNATFELKPQLISDEINKVGR